MDPLARALSGYISNVAVRPNQAYPPQNFEQRVKSSGEGVDSLGLLT